MTPRESVMMMAAVSGAPLYVPYASQIGAGALGGKMASFVEMGRETRKLVDRILNGAPPTSIVRPDVMPISAHVDWRQVRQWGIDEQLIPSDAVIHFREPTFWEAYRTQTIVAAVVIVVQAALIIALLVERRRRRSTAAALAESEQRIRLAAHAARLSPIAWSLSGDGNPPITGPADAAGVSERTTESFEGVLETVHPADRHRLSRAAHSAAANHSEFEAEYRVIQPDGDVRWFAARGRRANDGSDRLTGVRMDITGRKAAELQAEADRAALTHLSRVATLGQLSAAIAHQINQPLAAILGNAEAARKMLGRKNPSREYMGEILDDIVAENNRAAEVIQRLVALYKRGDIQLSGVDLNELVRETLVLLRTELAMRTAAPVLELAASQPPVQGSRVHLQQVLLNLVLNAADAVATLEASQRMIIVRTSADGEQARVCVQDRGTGIASSDLPHLFEEFWSTKATGLGVGLSICKVIITAHHGTLTAANHPEGGATFCFTLPMAVFP